MIARTASGRLSLAALALSCSALALAPVGTACAQWREAYQSDWLGPAPHNEGMGERAWIQADYLVWQLSDTHLPPLITARPVDLTNPLPAGTGALDDPFARVIAGNQQVGDNWRSGVSVRGGVWIDPWALFGVTGDFFDAGDDDFRFNTGPSGAFILARPVFDAQNNNQIPAYSNIPGQITGAAHIRASDEFDGAGLGLQKCLFQGERCDGGLTFRLDVVAGYRFYEYGSRLAANQDYIALTGNQFMIPAGVRTIVDDEFKARSEFHGGELAFDGRLKQGRWWVDGLAKVALGDNRRSVTVDGRTLQLDANDNLISFQPGGLLTSEVTNMGRYADSEFEVIPEFRLGFGCQLMPRLSARMGYHVVIWDGVVQAASHLPPYLAVDVRNLPPVAPGGGPFPLFPGLQEKTLVAHGFDLGFELAY